MHDFGITSRKQLARQLCLQDYPGSKNAVHMCVRYGFQDVGMHKAWLELTDPRSMEQGIEACLLYAMELDDIVKDRPGS